jgi:hypothetical protein
MSEPGAVYETILKELEDGELSEIERKVYQALERNPKGLKRQQLVAMVFGQVTGMQIVNNNTKDRKVRKAIESLRARLVPIVSSSAEAGYRLDTSAEGRRRMVQDLISRRDKLSDLIRRAEKFYSLPGEYKPAEHARQERLLA